ncbi:MAG: glycosyltransferase family 4 protein, partial [Acidobacteria bacterium]|nr:glycosyltransferase family 4 protein [Acidobacteriota bacterium]
LEIIRVLRQTHPSWGLHLIAPDAGPLAGRAAALGATVAILPMPISLARLGEHGAGGRGRAGFAVRLLQAASDMPAYQQELRRTLDAFDADVLHTNGFKAHITGARARAGAALVWHIHEYVSSRPVSRALLRRYVGRCAAIIANSYSVADDVRAVVGQAAPIHVIYNAVNLATFEPAGPAADLDALAGLPPVAPGTVRVGLVGTFAKWKGHETFLRAIAALRRDVAVRAYIIGAPLYETQGSQHSLAALQALAQALQIGDRVGFTGFVDGVAPAFRALDIAVHASTDPEPFGLAIAEAMACGRALTTSATGGAAELVQADVDALTHLPGDAADLARTIETLAVDAALRRGLGERARVSAVRRFDAAGLAGVLSDTYASVARARAGNIQ